MRESIVLQVRGFRDEWAAKLQACQTTCAAKIRLGVSLSDYDIAHLKYLEVLLAGYEDELRLKAQQA
jgi:hypothetical protein